MKSEAKAGDFTGLFFGLKLRRKNHDGRGQAGKNCSFGVEQCRASGSFELETVREIQRIEYELNLKKSWCGFVHSYDSFKRFSSENRR